MMAVIMDITMHAVTHHRTLSSEQSAVAAAAAVAVAAMLVRRIHARTYTSANNHAHLKTIRTWLYVQINSRE